MDHFRYLRFVFVCHAFLSVPVSLVITCLERVDFLALLYATFSVFVSLSHVVSYM